MPNWTTIERAEGDDDFGWGQEAWGDSSWGGDIGLSWTDLDRSPDLWTKIERTE